MLEVAEDGREENIPLGTFGDRILSDGLKERFCGDLGEAIKAERECFEGARSSGMLRGGTGISGRVKSG